MSLINSVTGFLSKPNIPEAAEKAFLATSKEGPMSVLPLEGSVIVGRSASAVKRSGFLEFQERFLEEVAVAIVWHAPQTWDWTRRLTPARRLAHALALQEANRAGCRGVRRERYAGYEIVGACVPRGIPVDEGDMKVPHLGTVGDTRRVCDEVGADTVLVARGGYSSSADLRSIAWDLEGSDIDLVVGERHEGPILRRRDGTRLDRRTAHRWVASIGKRAGLRSSRASGRRKPRLQSPGRSIVPRARRRMN